MGDKWFPEILALYRNVLAESGLSRERQDEFYYCVRGNLLSSVRANTDYHIEVNGKTKLGMPGGYRNQNNIIHFEIFSGIMIPHTVNEWYPGSEQFVRVESEEKNDYFNAQKIIAILQSANFINERIFRTPIIFSRVLRNYLEDRGNVSLQYAVVKRLHSYATLTEGIWNQIVRASVGATRNLRREENLRIFLAYKWFSKEMLKQLKPIGKDNFNRNNGIFAVHYHPVRLLAWLDKTSPQPQVSENQQQRNNSQQAANPQAVAPVAVSEVVEEPVVEIAGTPVFEIEERRAGDVFRDKGLHLIADGVDFIVDRIPEPALDFARDLWSNFRSPFRGLRR